MDTNVVIKYSEGEEHIIYAGSKHIKDLQKMIKYQTKQDILEWNYRIEVWNHGERVNTLYYNSSNRKFQNTN